MKKKYHHLANGTFRNPEGSKVIDMNFNWSFKVFNQEKKKLDMTFPESNIIKKEKVLLDLNNFQKEDYVAWIGHATFLLKLGEITIITDPVFSKNAGPLFFGPKRFTEPALKLNEIPRTDIFLLTHNHYDHQDMKTIMRFPYKESKVLLPLGLKKYFKINRFKDVNEMDWYDQIRINQNLNITFLPSVHWSKRSLTDTNKTLWGSYLIEYKGKKILNNEQHMWKNAGNCGGGGTLLWAWWMILAVAFIDIRPGNPAGKEYCTGLPRYSICRGARPPDIFHGTAREQGPHPG